MVDTTNLGITHLLSNSDQPEVPVNQAFDDFDAALCEELAWTITGDTTATQAQLASAILHVLGGAPAAAFTFSLPAGKSRLFAVRNTSGKTATVQVTGAPGTTVALATGYSALMHSDGTNVRQMAPSTAIAATPFTLGTYIAGLPPEPVGSPAAADTVFTYVFAEAVTFPAGLTGSQAYAGSAATAAASFDIEKNGSPIGTIDFAIGSNTATFSFSLASPPAAVSFAAGERITIKAPDPQDATLGNVSITLLGTRG